MQRLSRPLLAAVAMMAAASLAVAQPVGRLLVTASRDTFRACAAVMAGALVLVVLLVSLLPSPVGNKLARGMLLAWYYTCMQAAMAKELFYRRVLQPMVYALGIQLHMAFPGTVTADIAFGIVGELAFDGPYRSTPARISHGTAADIVVGRWFTMAADGTVRPGGTGAIAGLFMAPKGQASLGTAAGGALAPTMTVPTGTIGEFCYMGALVVAVGSAVAIGQAAWYDTTTGVVGAGAPGAGQAAIPNSKFIRYANAAAGLAVLEVTN